jgi:hypothetical protein
MHHDNNNANSQSPAGGKSWFERNVNLIIAGLIVACAATLIAQAMCRFELLGLHPLFSEEHPAHFELESLFGFEAMFGFVAFVTVVFLGRVLRIFVKRDEDYYDS